jgi:aldose 1-epimerase
MQLSLRRPKTLLALLSASLLVVSMLMLATGGVAAAAATGKHSTSHKKSSGSSPSRNHRAKFSVKSIVWGSANGTPVDLYTLGNGTMKVKVTNYGGVVQSIWVPKRNGKLVNVALGFPTLSDYVHDFTQGANQTPWPLPGGSGNTYFGAIIGRYANRIANHSFNLNGKTYTLDANNGNNTLHGGYLGWNTVVWTATPSITRSAATLTLTHSFPAGEGCLPSLSPGCTGFPAPILATVTYSVTRDDQLKIRYDAVNQSTTDATVINLTNHTYFNLGGEASGTVENQLLALNSDKYTPVDTNLIPEPPYFVSVAGTPYDFRHMHTIGKYLRATNLPDGTSGPYKQLQIAHGYDNNWVLNGYPRYRLVAVAQDPRNGVTLWTYTDQPGVQVYTGNFLVGDLIGTSYSPIGRRTHSRWRPSTIRTRPTTSGSLDGPRWS